jgi:hypothetical protein
MAMTACLAKFVSNSTCLSKKGRTSWINRNGPERLVFLDHGDDEERASACELDQLNGSRFPIAVGIAVRKVGNMHRLPRTYRTTQTCCGTWVEGWIAPPYLGKGWRHVMHGGRTEGAVILAMHGAELGSADANCVCQHGPECRLQLAS